MNQGVQWAVLTNGINWEVYRIKFERPVDYDLLCSFNFLELNPRKREDHDLLFILCKEGLNKAAIEEFHAHVRSVNKFIIGAIVQADSVLDVIRRELKRMSPGIKVEKDEIEKILVNDVLKRDVVEGEAAKEAKSNVKKMAGKSLKKQKTAKANNRPS